MQDRYENILQNEENIEGHRLIVTKCTDKPDKVFHKFENSPDCGSITMISFIFFTWRTPPCNRSSKANSFFLSSYKKSPTLTSLKHVGTAQQI